MTYISGVSGSRTIYAPVSDKKKASHPHGFGIVTGLASHLLSDVKDTAVGIPTGLVQTFEHPIRSIEDMGKTTWHDWSPLFHGHVGEFGHQFFEHPLAPILDVATFVTGGGALAGRAARIVGDAGNVAKAAEAGTTASRLDRLAHYSSGKSKLEFLPGQYEDGKFVPEAGSEGRKMTKDLSPNPVSRFRQEKLHGLANKLAEHAPNFFGKDARYNRMFQRHTALRKAALMTQVATIVKAADRLHGADSDKFVRHMTEHSYEQTHTFAFQHPVDQAVPENFVVIKADPTERLASAVEKASSDVSAAARKVVKGRNTLSEKHGLLPLGAFKGAPADERAAIEAQLKIHRAALKKAKSDLTPHAYIEKDIAAMEEHLGKVKDLAQAQRKYRQKLKTYTTEHERFFGKEDGVAVDQHFANLGNRYYLNHDAKDLLAQAKKIKGVDGEEKILIAPKHAVKDYAAEAAGSARALKHVYHEGTSLWKTAVLGYRPGFFVNNAVGNLLMYAMTHDPATAIRGGVDAWRNLKRDAGPEASDLQKAIHSVTGKGYENKWFKDQVTNTLADNSLRKFTSEKARRKQAKWRMGLFGVTHNWADVFLRRATIHNETRAAIQNDATTLAHYKQLRKSGMKDKEAFNQAADAMYARDAKNGGEIRRSVSEKVMNTMGDYHSYNDIENQIRKVVPFYAWDRHITRHIAHMFGEKPGKLNVFAKMGQQGAQTTEKVLGDIPNFLKGAIPLSILGLHIDHPSRHAVLTTQGLNPYATIGDLGDTLKALVGKTDVNPGESVGSQLNPFISSFISRVSGVNPLTGVPIKPSAGGLAGGVLMDPIKGLPQVTMADRFINGTPKPKRADHPFLYEKTPLEQFLSVMGVPYKQESVSAARKLKKKQDKQKAR